MERDERRDAVRAHGEPQDAAAAAHGGRRDGELAGADRGDADGSPADDG